MGRAAHATGLIAYTTSMMATMCTKSPSQVLKIAQKVFGYLQRTVDYGLIVQWQEKGLVMFCDAAFAPQGSKSHGGWVVSYGGVPIAWRSGRQTMVTLSTAESELLSMLDGAIAMKGVETILVDADEMISIRTIMSDSTSARSISTGSSSWRTRHLRIKASWLSELSHGMFSAVHFPGERQWADILTAALSAARTKALLDLWGVRGYEERHVLRATTPMVSAKAVVALLCCLMMVSVQAAEDSQLPSRGSSVQVDWDTAGLLMILLMLLGAVVLWEAIRWSFIEIYQEYLPGDSARKLNSVSYKRQPPRPQSGSLSDQVREVQQPAQGPQLWRRVNYDQASLGSGTKNPRA